MCLMLMFGVLLFVCRRVVGLRLIMLLLLCGMMVIIFVVLMMMM